MNSNVIDQHPIVSRAEWLAASKRLLQKEKELTRQQDALAVERRNLPWVRLEKPYVFQGRDGRQSLAQLFEGRSQLFLYHFMFGPDWDEGCRSCSMVADHIDASALHLAHRDVTLVVASRAPFDKIAAFQQRMGWTFKWVSTVGGDFNFDFGVSFTPGELESGQPSYNFGSVAPYADEVHGGSVFYRDASGHVFHTYSSYGRGVEPLLLPYFYLDRVPKGRDEASLPMPMAWFRHHDRYEAQPLAVSQ